ncbi:MAG: hypothetical protein WKG00_14280 [Polyangiaceae bacterium]
MSGMHRAMDRRRWPKAVRVAALTLTACAAAGCGLDWTVTEGGSQGAGGAPTSASHGSGASTGSPSTGVGAEGGAGTAGGSTGTASSVTSSTAAAAGGAAGTGGAASCEEAGADCTACSSCAESGPCLARANACFADEFCACMYDCNDDYCFECERWYWPEGDQLWADFGMCVICDECPGDCADSYAGWCN